MVLISICQNRPIVIGPYHISMKKEFKMAQVILVYDELSENRPLTHFAIIYFLWFLFSTVKIGTVFMSGWIHFT